MVILGGSDDNDEPEVLEGEESEILDHNERVDVVDRDGLDFSNN